MKQAIIVKKKRSHRYCARFLTALVGAVAAMTAAYAGIYALLMLPAVAAALGFLCYYETWQVAFLPVEIRRRVFFRDAGAWTYGQIRDARRRVSYTLEDHVRLTFTDGSSLILRLEDENAGRAVDQIARRRSIRVTE